MNGFRPRAGWLGEYLATRTDSVTLKGFSGGTLTVVNALRRVGALPDGSKVILNSPVVSYPTASSVASDLRYNQPWGDVSNLLAPSLNPVRFGSGFLDLFCGFCVHRGNNF